MTVYLICMIKPLLALTYPFVVVVVVVVVYSVVWYSFLR